MPLEDGKFWLAVVGMTSAGAAAWADLRAQVRGIRKELDEKVDKTECQAIEGGVKRELNDIKRRQS